MTYDFDDGDPTHSGKRKALLLARFALAVPCLLLILSLVLGSAPAMRAQAEEHPNRRVIRSQKPDYPPVLKLLGIGGVVRLNAKVLANGNVAEVQILGGNPVLAESAIKAVKAWKYAAGTSSTNETLTIEFNPH